MVTKNTSVQSDRSELISSIDAIASRGGITRDRAITAWYASTMLGIDEDDALDAADVDGPEDAGCDFIFVDEDQETIYVLQGYVSERKDKAAPIKKWNSLAGAVANIKNPISFKHAGRPDIYEKLCDLDHNSFSIVFGLVSLAAKSDQIARQNEATSKSDAYGQNVSFFYEYQETLFDKFVIAKAAERNVKSDEIKFNGAVIDLRGSFGNAIVGTVYASELARLHQKYPTQLFEGNIRLFIGERKGGINEKIIDTAANRSGDFWALNNGITIVAAAFDELTSSKYRIKNFSIVNGCQTTVSLSKAVASSEIAGSSQVLVRIVAAKKTLLTDIVRFNNTQNPVKLSAVRLLDPIQEGLRSSFVKIGYTYAPKQEGARSARNPKKIELDKIAQYLASMSDETILEAVTRKMELFDKFYKTVFPRGITAEKVFLSWLIAQEVEKARMELIESTGGSDKVLNVVLGIHGTPWGIYVTNYLIQFIDSDMSKLVLSKMDQDSFKKAISKYAKLGMQLYSELATNIVEDSDIRNQIRVKSFLDKLKRQLQLRNAALKKHKLPKLQNVIKDGA